MRSLPALALAFVLLLARADAATNSRVPPPGLALSETQRASLSAGVVALEGEIQKTRAAIGSNESLARLLPDVLIFHKATDWALRHDEIYRSNEVGVAGLLLKQGMERARQLREGQAPWLTATGLVVRGYVSRLDGSVQPYGLLVPASYRSNTAHRLDVWLHGRDNHLTELKFIHDRLRSAGEFAPPHAIVLHPYGRYCNAFKFAGEVDVFEAMQHARSFYNIAEQRMAMRGFSMGGAGAWHLAAHHPHLWTVATPGAGFAETAEYTGALSRAPKPPLFEQKLWQLYDATAYAANFFNLPVIAYNGDQDKQRQAADMMERAMRAEGLVLPRVWGTNAGHKYTPAAKAEIEAFVDETMRDGKPSLPPSVRFTTRTLRYNEAPGVKVLALERHWEPASISVLRDTGRHLLINTTNITAFSISLPDVAPVEIDGSKAMLGSEFVKTGRGGWRVGALSEKNLRKRHGLQGPIDDAFMDSFLFVRPTGATPQPEIAAWIQARLSAATNDWRAQFRGEVRVKEDREVTEADIAEHHLILWGDPRSNRLLARFAGKLPIQWDARTVRVGKVRYDATTHVPVMIYPNPLNPKRYIVLNSGFTFAGAGAGSNAQQTPKLPDYAVMSTRGEVATAGFFNEQWELK